MYVVTVSFSIKPDQYQNFMPLMIENAQLSLEREPGCKQFDICESIEDECKVFLYEVYDAKAEFDKHLNTQHFKVFTQRTNHMVLDKSVYTFKRCSL